MLHSPRERKKERKKEGKKGPTFVLEEGKDLADHACAGKRGETATLDTCRLRKKRKSRTEI